MLYARHEHSPGDGKLTRSGVGRRLVSREVADLVLEHLPEAVVVLDSDLNVEWANREAEALANGSFGFGEGSGGCFFCFAKEGPLCEDGGCRVRQTFETGRRQEAVVKFKDGATRFVRCQPILDSEGNLERVISFLRDVSTLRKGEMERIEKERRVQEARRLESLGSMAGGIAHDFNNLLTAILGNIDLARHTAAGEAPQQYFLANAMKSCRDAAELTAKILAYTGSSCMFPSRLILGEIAEKFLPVFSGDTLCGSRVRLRRDPDEPEIAADPGMIETILRNLILNAEEAASGNASAVIQVHTGVRDFASTEMAGIAVENVPPPGRYAFLSVTDSGCGMDATMAARAFDPFFTSKLPGRGLGLPVVRGMARRHGGAVLLDTKPGVGTVVTVLFPVNGKSGGA